MKTDVLRHDTDNLSHSRLRDSFNKTELQIDRLQINVTMQTMYDICTR